MPVNKTPTSRSPGKQDTGAKNVKSYPTAQQVNEFHRNSDLDKDRESQHHSLGPSRYQAAPGDHNHDGSSSSLIFDNVTITGSKSSGAAFTNLMVQLAKIGLIDGTTA
jgi:hypothetical protein